jgi:teichoic acid transport system ATP-binding protein
MRPKIVFKNVSKSFTLYKKQSDKLLDVIRLNKSKDNFYALKNVSFTINEGEAIGIVGLNGSGKSTLSNLLAQIIPPSSGSIEINGETSLIAISAGLNNQLSGLENIELKCLMHGLKKEEIKALKDEIIEFADIGKFINQPVKNYSSGMKSRLGFAISIHTNPDILIVDEALSVGDQTFYKKCLNKMNEFKSQGKTIVFISHSISQIKEFCDRVMWVSFGRVEKFDSTEVVVKEYNQFISWFNSLSETEKKNYRKQKLDEQYLVEQPEFDINPLGRQSYRKKKEQKESKRFTLFSIQCILLTLAVIVSAAFMFGSNPVQAIGDYLQSSISKESVPKKTKANSKIPEEQIVPKQINKAGIVSVGHASFYIDQDLKGPIGDVSFSEDLYVVEQLGEVYKVRTKNNITGFTKSDNINLLESELPVSLINLSDFRPLFPERFSNAYSYFLTFLDVESEEVKSTLSGLTSEDVLSNQKKTLTYSFYDAQYTVNQENRTESISIGNLALDLSRWDDLKGSASLKSKDDQYYYYITGQYRIVIDTVNKSATVSLNK